MILAAGIIVVLIPVLVLIFLSLQLSRRYGEIKNELNTLREVDDYEKEREAIADRAALSADKLLELMRSPHSNH